MESQKARECDGALVCVAVRGVDGVPTSGCLEVGIDMRSTQVAPQATEPHSLPSPPSSISSPNNHHYYVFAPPFQSMLQTDLYYISCIRYQSTRRLKYVAIEEGYLFDGVVDLHLTKAGLKRALKAMTDLKEIIVVRDITIGRPNDFSLPRMQIKFYAKRKTGEAEGS